MHIELTSSEDEHNDARNAVWVNYSKEYW
jgi:hypothetical protein